MRLYAINVTGGLSYQILYWKLPVEWKNCDTAKERGGGGGALEKEEGLIEWYNADCGLGGGVRLDGTMLTVGWVEVLD